MLPPLAVLAPNQRPSILDGSGTLKSDAAKIRLVLLGQKRWLLVASM